MRCPLEHEDFDRNFRIARIQENEENNTWLEVRICPKCGVVFIPQEHKVKQEPEMTEAEILVLGMPKDRNKTSN